MSRKQVFSRYAGRVVARGASGVPKLKANVLPPFLGKDSTEENGRAPYSVTIHQLLAELGDSLRRRHVLRGYLRHRAQLHALGFTNGFQWIDGSFVESKPDPSDIDVVTFFVRPQALTDVDALVRFMDEYSSVFDAEAAKREYSCDAYFVDLSVNDVRRIVSRTHFWFGLWSHRKRDYKWKGFLQIELGAYDGEAEALSGLERGK